MADEWPSMSLREACVSLIDCEHRTPPAAECGYPYVGIPQVKDGRINLNGARRIACEHFEEWTRKADPETFDVVLSRRCNPGETGYVPGKVSNLLWVRILSYFDPMGHVFLNRFFGGLSAVHYGGSK